MKKFTRIIIITIILALIATSTFAQSILLSYDGIQHHYTGNIFDLKVNGESITTDIPPIIINDRTLVPVRAIFEKLGAGVKWDEASQKISVGYGDKSIQLTINDKKALLSEVAVEMDVPAKIINNRTMVPLRFVGEQLGMKVGWFPQSNLITIDADGVDLSPGKLESVEYTLNDDKDEVRVLLDKYKSYYVMKLANPERIVIDFSNATVEGNQQQINVNSKLIKSIRYAQFDENTARVVLDTIGQPVYNVEEKDGQFVMSVSKGKDTDDPSRGDGDTGPVSTPGDLKINYSPYNDSDRITISLKETNRYNITRLTDPDRILIDIPNLKVIGEPQPIEVNSRLLKAIKYSQYNENTVRIVFETVGQPHYQTDERDGQLVISIENPTYINMAYHSNGDRTYVTLAGAKLTEGGSELKKFYQDSYDQTSGRYIMTFASNLASLGTGIMKINDSVLDSVEVINNADTQQTSVIFNAKEKFTYNTITRPDNGDTEITLLKPVLTSDKLVVIDAGHGGKESGAVYGNLYEKDINLDIALRLNALLKSKGIKTYMIRETDVYVGLYERANIANNLNATLFLSIHNNANDKASKGTETLYFPQNPADKNFNGKRFAQIIQSNMVKTLGTVNRGIVERPNLVVLRETKMHSALAEVAFMDNKDDRANLLKDDFKQKAAQSLCDAIIQSLSEIK